MIWEFDLSKKTIQQNFEAKVYTDYTLAFEFVVVEIKNRQIDTITQWNWDLSCQKKRTMKIRGKSVHGSYTYPWVCCVQDKDSSTWCSFQVIQGSLLSKKTIQQNFEAKVYTDHTLTREFVAGEIKMRQIGTITEWFGNWTCQKKWFLRKMRATCRTDHIHYPWVCCLQDKHSSYWHNYQVKLGSLLSNKTTCWEVRG